MNKIKRITLAIIFLTIFHSSAMADVWKISAYCSCKKCCGKSDGITASGDKVKYGMIALNWLPFGTNVYIKDLGIFVVKDRGSSRIFGSKTNHKKQLDIYMDSHKKAIDFGIKYKEVVIM